ncbi:hypothetical protein V8C40DRAFT_137551 [Trichoderma camerunense]
MSALFNFKSLLLVILLLICTSTYVHHFTPGIMDRNKNGVMGIFWKCARIGERLKNRKPESSFGNMHFRRLDPGNFERMDEACPGRISSPHYSIDMRWHHLKGNERINDG